MIRRIVPVFAFILLITTACTARNEYTQHIPPGDARILLSGRFDRTDPAGPRCAWTGSAVTIRFKGTGAHALLAELGCPGNPQYDVANHFNVIVDGSVRTVVGLVRDSLDYPLISGLKDTVHTLTLLKRTEPSVGTVQLRGFRLAADAALMAPPSPPERRIEFVGNSITCGYGNEAPNAKARFSPATENGYLAYGAVTARNLSAEYRAIAWSGRGMYRNIRMDTTGTLPQLYPRTLPADSTSRWDYISWVPDVICINLGTNDFNKGNPTEAQFAGTYRKFIGLLRNQYPDARIFCLVGTMMGDGWPKGNHALTTTRNYLTRMVDTLNAAGDTGIHYVEFPPQNRKRDGIGASHHPSLTTHRLMAAQLTAVIKEKMNW